MAQKLDYLKETPSQTAGPYVHIGLAPGAAGFDIYRSELGWDIAGPNAAGERIRVEGVVIDGTGNPVKDVLIEAWQANASGVYAHPESEGEVEDGFRGWGRVINISSINGQKGQFGQANYSAAKAGLIGLSKALAQEGAKKGITVNTVCPGYIDTEMVQAVPEKVLEGIIATIPVGRLGKAEEIASMCAYLASDEAAFITGATMTVNGAQYIAT